MIVTSFWDKARAVVSAKIPTIGYGSSERALEAEVLRTQFSDIGLDYEMARLRTQGVLSEFGLTRSDTSLHYELFSAIAGKTSPERILEIGTFRGEFSAFLGALFPDAYVETWDLPSNPQSKMSSYGEEFSQNYSDQSKTRLNNLERFSNVSQVLQDSTYLIESSEPFDLIWIDGDHTFPVVAFDILNCLRLSTAQSWIVLDDVKLAERREWNMGSTETLKCLNHLANTGIAVYSLIYKRIGQSGRAWRDVESRKHLAVLRKT